MLACRGWICSRYAGNYIFTFDILHEICIECNLHQVSNFLEDLANYVDLSIYNEIAIAILDFPL